MAGAMSLTYTDAHDAQIDELDEVLTRLESDGDIFGDQLDG